MQAELQAGWTTDRVGRPDRAGWPWRIARALGALARPGASAAPTLRVGPGARALTLGSSDALRMERAVGTTLRVLDGTLWITLDGDRRDVIVDRGERFVVDRDRPLLALPLGRSARVEIDRAADPVEAA